jgi:hypothetical protein
MPEQPHDQLFRVTFSRPSEAASFLQAHLPPALSSAIDWSRLTRLDPKFQVPHGTRVEADILFSAPWRDPDGAEHALQLAILLEHQSTPDPRMPLRLLSYMVRIFESQLDDQGLERPVPVIPVVLYHGRDRWTADLSFADWLGLPASARPLVAEFLPDFRYILESRRAPDPENYRGSDTVRVLRLLLDHARDPLILELIEGPWRGLILSLERVAEDKAMHPILGFYMGYLYRHANKAHGRLSNLFDEARATRLKEIAMTSWQEAVNEGRAERAEELRRALEAQRHALEAQQHAQQAARRLLVRVCERSFGPLPERLRARVDAADPDTLALWTERAMFCQIVEAVFEPLEN